MNDPNKPYDSYWLELSVTLDEIKEESVEIKKEPFDDIADIKHEDLIYYPSDNVKDETMEVNEDFGEFADIKLEEPVLDGINSIQSKSAEIKEEPVDNVVDIKEEELFKLPITDVSYPRAGDTHSPLTIDINKGMYSKCQMSPPRPTMMKATKTITVNGSVRVTRDAVIKLDRNPLHLKLARIGPIATDVAPVAPIQSCVFMSGLSIFDCSLCKFRNLKNAEMEKHVRVMHPERPSKIPAPASPECAVSESLRCVQYWGNSKCTFCGVAYSNNKALANHVRSKHHEELVNIRQRLQLLKCDFCDLCYTMGACLENHVRLMHSHTSARYRSTTRSNILLRLPKRPSEIRDSLYETLQMNGKIAKCDFCGEETRFYHISPYYNENARRFFNSLELTQEQRASTVRFIKSDGNRAIVCVNHLKKTPRLIDPWKNRSLLRSGNRAKCDFCGEETHSYLVSPNNHGSARKFFNNLELTQAQRASTVRFFKNDGNRAIVCGKHVNKNPT